ncbi:AI-2E family transporter [Weissella confusa]|uniref:AI-2E family transporter n=1 Tax=Weissella confusa TaxID=1583 RepID=UPI001898B883|nr:AI-2E family transporter [Weissella confusa]
MKEFKSFILREDVQKFIALGVIVLIIALLHDLISVLLLTAIIGYLAVKAANRVSRLTKIPYGFSVLIVYLLAIFVFVFAMIYIVPTLINQFAVIPDEIMKLIKKYPVIKEYFDDTYKKLNLLSEITDNWKSLLASGINTISTVGTVLSRIVLSIFMSFVLAITWQRLRIFGTQFLHSDYPKFFKRIYDLGRTFILILGSVIEVQLIIAFINTILMMIGLSILGVPSIMVMGLMIFILGLIPIAGVIISLFPLSVMSFAALGWVGMVEVWIMIALIHMFESYFLHPRLMASRTELPVFLTFATIIVMEHLLGAWGLIIGVPIVAFILAILGVQDASISKHVKDNKVVAEKD